MKFIVVLMAGMALLTACHTDIGDGVNPASEEAKVYLTISASKNDKPVSRAQTAEETVISDVRVLVMKDTCSDGTYTFAYMVPGIQVTS